MTVVLAVLAASFVAFGRMPSLPRRAARGAPSARRRMRSDLDRRVAGLVRIGLAAGLPLTAALEVAAGELEGAERREVEAVLRRIRLDGASAGLLASDGPLSPMLHRLAAAHAAGAPMVDTLAAHAAEARVRERTRLLQRGRTLPVRLVVPLALLLLPGFTALVVGPSVIEQVRSVAGAVP